jgi:hypothetical protein
MPSGTVVPFFQASAPVGWTQVTAQNDKLIRVVSGSGGGSGGTNAFSTVNAQTTTGNHTLAAAELPSVTSGGSFSVTCYFGGSSSYLGPISNNSSYGFGGYLVPNSGSAYAPAVYGANPISYVGGTSGSSSVSSTSNNTSGAAHNHPITMAIQYIDIIIASKN